jgi:hypothetical protein
LETLKNPTTAKLKKEISQQTKDLKEAVGKGKHSPLAQLLSQKAKLEKRMNEQLDYITMLGEDITMAEGEEELLNAFLQHRTAAVEAFNQVEEELKQLKKRIGRQGSGACGITDQRIKELLDEFMKSHKGKTSVTAMKKFIAKKMKDGDCGCGCCGKKAISGGALRDCPEGFRNDGLTCLENCKAGETDDGLTCRNANCPPGFTNTGLTCYKPPKTHLDPCPDGFQDTGLTCQKNLRCWQTGDWTKPYWDPGHQRTHCDGPQTIDMAGRNHRHEGAETRGHPIRSKQITGRVDWEATAKELEKGFEDAFGQNGALARAFDPEKNGVGAAFRKFGADTEAAFQDIGEKMRKAFDPANMRRAFEEFGKMLETTLGNADWWKDTMGNPDTWITILGVIASVAATVLSAGTLGPAAFIALNMVGPVTKMIGDAAQGRPVDGLDFLAIAFAMIPGAGAGASAASNAASKAIIEGVKFGATAAKALPYAQKAVTLGKIVVSGVKVAQAVGAVPSTCLANCPDLTPEKLDAEGVAEELEKLDGIDWGLDDVDFNFDIAGMDDENLQLDDSPNDEADRIIEEIENENQQIETEEERIYRERNVEIDALYAKLNDGSATLEEQRKLNQLIDERDGIVQYVSPKQRKAEASGGSKRNRRKK